MCQFFPKVLLQAVQGNSLWYLCKSKGTLAAVVIQKGDFCCKDSLGTSVSHPYLASGCFFTLMFLCNCFWVCAVNQVTELIQITNRLFIYRVVVNTGCFSYQNDARNWNAGATEEAESWDREETKAVGIDNAGEETCLSSWNCWLRWCLFHY